MRTFRREPGIAHPWKGTEWGNNEVRRHNQTGGGLAPVFEGIQPSARVWRYGVAGQLRGKFDSFGWARRIDANVVEAETPKVVNPQTPSSFLIARFLPKDFPAAETLAAAHQVAT